MDIYSYDDYKSFILEKIKENGHIKGYRLSLAKAAGCGRSFLSQALNSEIHLTPDHGAGLCTFWELDEDRADYFLDLMLRDRAANPLLRTRLEKRLNSRRHKRLSARVKPKVQIDSGLQEAVYYSSWHYAAVHTLTAIPAYRTADAIAQRLDLPSSLAERLLRELESIGLVTRKGHKWIVRGSSIHLPKESPLSTINQANWRHQATRHLGVAPDEGIHYSALFALSRSDKRKILKLLDKAIQDTLKIVEPSREEDMVCLNMDYFTV